MRQAVLLLLLSGLLSAAPGPRMTVYKTPTCGCCAKWVEHMKQAGFRVVVKEVPTTAQARKDAGIPEKYGSCHTGIVNGYAIEGHVPAADVQRLLKQKPKAVGLAVPGMPMGSPGMEGPYKDSYRVLLVTADGVETFQQYAGSR